VSDGSARRKTRETSVSVQLTLTGSGQSAVKTGVGFLDHLLEQLARHSGIDLTVEGQGDLHVDAHHTVEDVALTLGQALNDALGDRSGIARFGDATVPLDEALASVAIDLSGRPYAALDLDFASDKLGDLPSQMVSHFLWSLALEGRFALHARLLAGVNDHHKVEATFKALAIALRQALEPRSGGVPSTKGALK
jgi:imidazoleglycerol phosphate dehydratase HisB